MSIDEGALQSIRGKYDAFISPSVLRGAIEAYESAKAAEQPDPREDCPWKCKTGDVKCLCANQPVEKPSEEEISSLVTDLWKLIKPSQQAQEIRSSIKLDTGKYQQPEVDFIPPYVWDLVDVAAEVGLTKRELSNSDKDSAINAMQMGMNDAGILDYVSRKHHAKLALECLLENFDIWRRGSDE